MPDVKPADRHPHLPICSAGALNYHITTMVDRFLGPTLSYAKLNEVVGVLECVKLELYRRLAAPYEDKKCADHGDVYQDRT